jgi:hypothetical protein
MKYNVILSKVEAIGGNINPTEQTPHDESTFLKGGKEYHE